MMLLVANLELGGSRLLCIRSAEEHSPWLVRADLDRIILGHHPLFSGTSCQQIRSRRDVPSRNDCDLTFRCVNQGTLSSTIVLTCALLAQCTSGFAGVFFEKILKSGRHDKHWEPSEFNGSWIRVRPCRPGVLLTDYTKVTNDEADSRLPGNKMSVSLTCAELRRRQGYTYLTWIIGSLFACTPSGGGC
eukprot:766871-Hanusia_phi.AAC.2